MWARVKSRTENVLLQMRFKAVFLFRPGYVQLLHGIRTKTRWYGAAYALMRPLYPLLKMLFPNYVTTTECRDDICRDTHKWPLRAAKAVGWADEFGGRSSSPIPLVGALGTRFGNRRH